MEWLDHLPPERRTAVLAFVSELVGKCPYCGKDVRRNDLRGIDVDEVIGCLGCVTAVVGACGICRDDVTNQTRTNDAKFGLVHRKCLDDLGRKGDSSARRR